MRKKLLPIGILLILALLGGGYWYLDYYNTNTSLATGQKVRFTVTHGMTTGDIATLLYNKKLIQTPDSFRMAARLKGLENHLQAGTYEITAGMSDGEIINILSKGKVHSNRFAVPEGATVNEVALKLEREHLTTAQEFKDACRNYAPYPYMQTSNPDVVYKAEGFLCPATYDFRKRQGQRHGGHDGEGIRQEADPGPADGHPEKLSVPPGHCEPGFHGGTGSHPQGRDAAYCRGV